MIFFFAFLFIVFIFLLFPLIPLAIRSEISYSILQTVLQAFSYSLLTTLLAFYMQIESLRIHDCEIFLLQRNVLPPRLANQQLPLEIGEAA